MPRVFVVQDVPTYNISPAMKFGEIKVMLPPGDANFSVQHTYDSLTVSMEEFDSSQDYLLLTGDPVAIGLATLLAGDAGDQVQFLKWDKQERMYLPITVQL